MIASFIALGSNLQQPERQLRLAVNAIEALPNSQLREISRVYRSPAVGPGTQPDYLNAVLRLDTPLAPHTLLTALQEIENSQGRVRSKRWGPRTLDLDILLYGDSLIDSPELSIPHPAMGERSFVLYPLVEVFPPNWVLPDGRELGTLVANCPRDDLAETDLRLD